MPPNRQIAVILNPKSGRAQGERRRAELERLLTRYAAESESGWRILETTAQDRGAAQAAQAVAEGANVIAAAGGDGTLFEVLNGVMGTGAILGVLPLGTGNDFARTLGIGTDLEQAVRTLCCGAPKGVDVGRTQGRWFLNVAGCGFDAVVADAVNHGVRWLHGTPAYVAAILRCLPALHPVPMRLTLDDTTQEVRAVLCSVANARTYGGGMQIAPEARIDDGLFDVVLIGNAGKFEFFRVFPTVFQGAHIHHPKVSIYRARHVHIESHPPLPVLVDGEVLGTTPATFDLTPNAIRIMAP